MKKILLCALCLVLSVCTAITAEAVQTDIPLSQAEVTAEESGREYVAYEAFVQVNYGSSEGYASTAPIRASVSQNDFSHTWAKRKGVLGYDTADMNGDGIEDLLVYYFSDEGNDNIICVDYFAFNDNADIIDTDSWIIYNKKEDTMKYYTGAMEYCVGGIIKKNGKNCLLVESYYTPYPAVDYHIEYAVLSSSKNGGLELSNFVRIDEGYMNTLVATLRSDGLYDAEYLSLGNYGLAGLKTGLTKIGLPKNPVSSSNIGKTLGCNTTDQFYTYFNTSFEKKSFYMVSEFTGYSNNYKTYNYVNYVGMYPAWDRKEIDISPAPLGNGTKYGDLDGDNKITSADALLILRASVKLENLNSKQSKLADVNKDGSVDSVDSLEVLRYSVGLSSNANINKTA